MARRHWPSAARSARRENGLRSYSRCARCRGEYGCTWATHVRRTDAPVVTWDLRGSQRPNSPRGIASPVFRLRRNSDPARLRSARPAPRASAVQHRHATGGRPRSRRTRQSLQVRAPNRSGVRGWRSTGRPTWRAGDSRDKRFAPSTTWGCRATGPVSGAEVVAWPAPPASARIQTGRRSRRRYANASMPRISMSR